jgi:hypothetical protein
MESSFFPRISKIFSKSWTWSKFFEKKKEEKKSEFLGGREKLVNSADGSCNRLFSIWNLNQQQGNYEKFLTALC